jgi:transcription antitermination factor NusG
MAILNSSDNSCQSIENFPWYALWVRSRHEKSVAELLTGKGFETFLPMLKSRRRWSDRMQEVELPLIPGYVFCRFDAARRLPILTTPGIVQIVSTGKTPQPADESEMAALITAVRSGVHLQLWPFLKTGQRVLIEEGPLRSVEGVLITTRGADQLILSISLLQRSVAVTVDRRWVKPIPDEVRDDARVGRKSGFSVVPGRERASFGR